MKKNFEIRKYIYLNSLLDSNLILKSGWTFDLVVSMIHSFICLSSFSACTSQQGSVKWDELNIQRHDQQQC